MDKKTEKIFQRMTLGASVEDINKINEKLASMRRGALKNVWDNILCLWKMINDKKAAWGAKTIAIGALLYAVSPIDALPDIVPILGLTDDAAVITAAVTALGSSLNKYKQTH